MAERPILSIDGFRDAARAGDPPDNVQIRIAPEAKIEAGESRSVEFTISTAAVDRVGDTIAAAGWDLKNYRKNPVVLWAHDSRSLPVARGLNVRVEDGALKASAEFTPAGVARFNDTVFEMVKSGFLNAVSVGFRPLKWAWTEDADRRYGIDFMEQELLEFSIVPIPANPEALIEARSYGIDIEPMCAWARDLLNATGAEVVLTRERFETLERAAALVAPNASPRRRLTERALDLARLKSP